MSTVSEITEGLKSAIKTGRTDIIRSVIETFERNHDDDSTLNRILNDQYLDEGTVLHLATKEEQTDIIRTLLAAGADPGIQNSQHQTPFDLTRTEKVLTIYNQDLLQAVAQNNTSRVCQLLAAGVSVNVKDSEELQNTPLHWAANYSNCDMVSALCSRGADVNAVNSDGYVALHDAVRSGNISLVKELLTWGAESYGIIPWGVDAGKTSIDLVVDNPELHNLLTSPPVAYKALNTKLENLTPNGHVMNLEESNTGHRPERLDSVASDKSSSNKVSSPDIPQLQTPVFKKHPIFNGVKLTPKAVVVTDEKLGLLWPQPQNVVQKEGTPFSPGKLLPVVIAPGPDQNTHLCLNIWRMRQPAFQSYGVDISLGVLSSITDVSKSHVLCHVNKRLCPIDGSYKLTISQKQIKLISHDMESLSYGISTLIQLISLYKEEEQIAIPLVLISDWPDLAYRGVLLDVSQGRIPNMNTLKNQLDVLSLMKINLVHLYTRFKKSDSMEWQLCYSKNDILELEGFCAARFLQLVPVIEVGAAVQFDDVPTLLPVFQDFVSCFTCAQFISVGPRLSSFIIDAPDEGGLNINEAAKLLPINSQQTLQLCGYPLHDLDPQLLQQLPPHIVFNEYGVKADHEFAKYCKPLSDQGMNIFLCPGTAAWNSLAGCPEATLHNIYNAAKCASSHGAIGMLVCHWTGKGHLTHQPISWAGFVLGGGLSWNSEIHWDYLLCHLTELMNQHVFHDEKSLIGQVIIELGRAETFILKCARSQTGEEISRLPDDRGSTLFQFLLHPDDTILEHLTPDTLQRALRHVKKCQMELSNVSLQCPNSHLILSELQLTTDLMVMAIRLGKSLILSGRNPNTQTGYAVVNMGICNLPPTARTDLANRLLELVRAYKSVWNARYLPHGIKESVHALNTLLQHLVPGGDNQIIT